MTIDQLLQNPRLQGVRRSGKGWKALCPAHEDRKASLSIRQADGKVLLKCHAGCPTEAVVSALGLRMADLFQDGPGRRTPPRPSTKSTDPLGWLSSYCRVPRECLEAMPLSAKDGCIAFEFGGTVRKLRPAEDKAFFWDPAGAFAPHFWPLPDGDLPATIWLTEGESDAIVARHLGLPALAVTKGAATPPPPEQAQELRRRGVRTVILCFDTDNDGRTGALKQAGPLAAAGLAVAAVDLAEAGIVDPLRGHKDLRDAWLASGDAQALRARLEAAVAPLPEEAIEKVAASEATREADIGPAEPAHLTDLGNARRLVARFGVDLRWCGPLGGWLVWDGQRWVLDAVGRAQRMAQEVARALYTEAAAAPDQAERKAIACWAMASESAARQRAMLDLAWSQDGVAVESDVWDTDPWMLNCANGTLDLRTGELRPHRCEDLITKLAPVNFHPEAADPIFERYLSDTTDGDTEFAAYLQRAAGYTLTGETTEDDLFLVLGPGGSGKTTFVEAFLATMGDYGVKASFETFLARHGAPGPGAPPRPDLVRLRGARLVAAVEPGKGRRLAEEAIKEMTGGDSLTARDLWARDMTFKPAFKLWLAANDAPAMSDDDTGFWRRLKRLPFEHAIPEDKQDPTIKRHLQSPAGRTALLAWAVEGCLAWQREGLRPCQAVKQRTAELRAEMDPIREFLDTCCILGPQLEAPAKGLRDTYVAWAAEMGARPINDRDWGKRLRGLGCKRGRTHRAGEQLTIWRGIGLVSTAEEPKDELTF